MLYQNLWEIKGKYMTRFLLSLVGYFVALVLGICIMLFGWGLTPYSWGWIIGGGIGASLLGALFQLTDKDIRR